MDTKQPTSDSNAPRKPRPRPIVFSCCGNNSDGALIKERMFAKAPEDAQEAFEKKHGFAPIHVDGPFYEVKHTSKSEENRVSITLKGRDMITTPNRWSGTFKGWKGYFNGIKAVEHDGVSYADDELVRPAFDEPADKENKTPRPRFGPNSVMRLADVEDAQSLDE